jgi:4-cresol dehydrogenase (hydroxylating)
MNNYGSDNISVLKKELSNFLAMEDIENDEEQLIDYKLNVSNFVRSIKCVVYPKSVSEIQSIVRLAGDKKIKLYPISQGKNWGFGSKLAVENDCIIIDFSRHMNNIRKVDCSLGYAVIEPGVTQEQLANYLKINNTKLLLDVTGSGKDTSIVGNILDKGVGYNNTRAEILLYFEVVLANGELLSTGAIYNNESGYLAPYTIGPDLKGLFTQSNFGIITSACIKLRKIPEYQKSFVLLLKNKISIDSPLIKLRELKQDGVINCVTHAFNNTRIKSISKSGSFFNHSWIILGNVAGIKIKAKNEAKIINKALKPYGTVVFFDSFRIQLIRKLFGIVLNKNLKILLNIAETINNFNTGIPSSDGIKTIFSEDNPDNSSSIGFIFLAVVFPVDISSINTCINICNKRSKEFSAEIAISLNLISEYCLEGLISIQFNRLSKSETKNIHNLSKILLNDFLDNKIAPYRVNINDMECLFTRDPHLSYWNLIKELKAFIDPNNIISPKRYNV